MLQLIDAFMKKLLFIMMLCLLTSHAWAADVIGEIVIKGQRKIESEAIRAKLVSQIGEPVSSSKIRDDVQAIYKMGFFYNVEVYQTDGKKGSTLTYKVTEKPSLGEIVYKGYSEVDEEELQEASGLKAFEIVDVPKIQESVEKILKLYEDKGFFLAKVSYRLEKMAVQKGQVQSQKLIFDIQENDKVKVKKITFLGNRYLTDSYLKGRIRTQEGGFFSFISDSGSYKQEIFDQDTQILNFLYFNEGYVQVKIDRPEVYVSPDKKGIYITFRIEEGEVFDVGKIDFSGDLLFDDQELLDAMEIDDSKVFVWQTLQRDLQSLTAKYGDLGYAFANVIPRTRIIQKDRKVDVTFEFDKGEKVYFGQINVVGNSKTRDKVVRRELRIYEGELYNESRKRESLARVRRLGFFEEVNFNTSTPADSPTQLDVEIVVKERNTGQIQVGAGFSSFSGFIFNGRVNQTNFLGKGQNLGVSIDLSDVQQSYNLSFEEPYLNDSRWSLGTDVFQLTRILTQFNEDKKGGAIAVGHPLGDYVRATVRYKIEDTDIELDSDADANIFPVETANGITSSLTTSIIYDKRNDRLQPSKGSFARASVEYAGLGGDIEFTKLITNFRYYKRLFWDVVWRNNLSYGLIFPNGSGDPPFNQLFLLGGANNLRGYDFFDVGRERFSQTLCDQLNNDAIDSNDCTGEDDPDAFVPFGGEQQFVLQTELEFPLVKDAGIRGVLFFDTGEAQDALVIKDFRSDVGFGFRWFSPIGPLRFEWGFPIARRARDQAVNFQFAIGSPF